jgi:hypothetical protein
LYGLAKQNNLDLAFAFGNEIAGSKTAPGFTNFQMVVTGLFEGWTNFLRGLERGNYLVNVDFVNFQYDSKRHQLKINGKVFSQ